MLREIRVAVVPAEEWPDQLREQQKRASGKADALVSSDGSDGKKALLPGKGSLCCLDGVLYLIQGNCAFCCEDTPEGRALLTGISGTHESDEVGTMEEAMRLILGGCSRERVNELAGKFRIQAPSRSCIIALKGENRKGPGVCELIRSLAPIEKGDLLIPYTPEIAVLIKQGEDLGETSEFAQALLDTAEEETGIRLRAGISDPHTGLMEWADGFREAGEALQVGEEFHLGGAVQTYRDQLLERLLREIPPERRAVYRRQFFNDQTEKNLGAETLETAEKFLESDLNMSDTARQLFIHRNTLTYRLDKIRKETGLDLRKFNDAVVYRVLSALPEERDCEKKKEIYGE